MASALRLGYTTAPKTHSIPHAMAACEPQGVALGIGKVCGTEADLVHKAPQYFKYLIIQTGCKHPRLEPVTQQIQCTCRELAINKSYRFTSL
jgi:hypothetical protein